MAGALALEKRDQDQPYSDANLAVRLYLFLPEELFDGAGLDTPLACSNLVPYAGAPLPETLGDFLDWTVAHELWHAVDVQRRLALLRREAGEDAAGFDAVLSDARAWSRLYDELVVGEWLGWENHGEAYLRGDELAPNATVMRGRTTYTLTHGVFMVAYADDAYAFRRTFTRRGHLPDEIRHLSDMGPLLNTGAVPTLYALFNDRDERFAEYGAWYTFSALVGEPDAFKALHPDLAAAYAARREAAARACSP